MNVQFERQCRAGHGVTTRIWKSKLAQIESRRSCFLTLFHSSLAAKKNTEFEWPGNF